MPLALSKPTRVEGSSPPFCAGRKPGAVKQALLWQLLHEDPSYPRAAGPFSFHMQYR